jgi:Phosphate transporter family
MEADVILVIVVATALAFDFTNGFHDTANAVATSISTKALRPRAAVALAAALNFVGAFISLEVAATVASDVVDPASITLTVVFAGLIGAITWNLITWYFGLPSSSSHALIGGVVGSAFAAAGAGAVLGEGVLGNVLIPAIVAPLTAFAIGAVAITLTYNIVGRQRPGIARRGFRLGQIVSASMFALAHGTNDAQKTMGVITLALIAAGLGHPLRGDRDRARHVQRRLANHQDDGDPGPQDGSRAGLHRRRRGIGRDPRLLAFRVPVVDDARHRRRDHGLGRREAPLGSALGGCGEHRRGLAAHPARRRGRRRGDVRVHAALRHRCRRAVGSRPDRDLLGDRGAGAPRPGGRAGAGMRTGA